MHVQVGIGHHSAALIPLTPANNVNMTYAKGVGATDNRPHIKVVLDVIERNFKVVTVFSVQVGNYLLLGNAFIFVNNVTCVFHLYW